MLSSSVVFHFAFLCLVHHNHAVELSGHIAPIDILNEVVNQIFSSLQFKTNNESKIKEYSKMHKYFASLARLHKNDWIELLKVTSLDNKIDHGAGDYMTIINEVLNEENKTEAVNDMLNEENVDKHIENFLGTLENVKELYLRNNSFITVNYEILHRFHRNRDSLRNKTVERLHLVQNDSDFWVPDGRRIYQGKRTKIKNFPFVASVHMFDQFTCAGSIIHADLVITAASCLQLAHNNRFYRENPAFISVRIGSSTYAGGDRVPVLEVYFYPSYEPKTLKNNLAILRLQRVIKFHKKIKNVKKIRVDTNAWALPSNTDGITIIGWGARKTSNKVYSPWKNKLAMDVLYFYGLADCRDVYSKTLVTKKNFCAGFISRGGGACNRDVGAPGVVNGILAGVVSFGSPNCGQRDSPTVFTKLGYYIDWIEDIMAQDPPKQSVRVTTRRPHNIPTIMSTLPFHDRNFLIEPIDLAKIPDIRDLDVRMPQEENEFINGEFNSIQSVSRQTFPSFPTIKQTIKPNPKAPKTYVDMTRLRDEREHKDSPETPYESPRLNPIYTVMGDFDDEDIFPSSNGMFAKTNTTIADVLARTRVQSNELKDANTQWQIGLELAENSESVEDTIEVLDDTREITTHNFKSTTTRFNVVDKLFKTNHTDAQKLLSSDDYDDYSESVVVQQSLPIHPISKDKDLSIKTPEKTIVNKKISGISHKTKQPERSIKEQDLDKEIDKFIENLDFEEILLSEEELNTQILSDTEFLEQQKNKKVAHVPINHKKYSLKEKKSIKNDDMFPLRDLAPKDDSVFPLQDQKKKAQPKNYFTFPLQDKKTETTRTNNDMYPQQEPETEPAPNNDYKIPLQGQKTKPSPKQYYTVSLQDEKTEPVLTNEYRYPQQEQETEPAPTNDYKFPLQGQKIKPPPKKYYLNSKQGQKTKPVLEKYNTVSLQDEKTEPVPTNDYIMYPQQQQEIEPAPTNDYKFPIQAQKTKSLQDEKTGPAPTNDYMYPQQEQEIDPAPSNDYKFPLQDKKSKPPPKKYYLNSKQGQKTKPVLEKYNTVPLQDEETKSGPKNDYIFPLQDLQIKSPTKKYNTIVLQDEETKTAHQNYDTFPLREPAPKNNDIFPLKNQKIQKTKPPPKSYYTFPLQDEAAEPPPKNDHMYAPQEQEIELGTMNEYKFPLQDQKTKPTPNKIYLNPQEKQKKTAQPQNYYTFPLQDEEAEPSLTNDHMYAPQEQEIELGPMKEYKFPLQDQKTKPTRKKKYLNPQQNQKKKALPQKYYTFSLQDEEKEPAPTNYHMYAPQEQQIELAPTDEYNFPLQNQKIKPTPKKIYLNPQQNQKKKAQPKNYYTFPLQDEKAEPSPTNEHMYAPQDQQIELVPMDEYNFPQQNQKTKPPPQKNILNLQQDQNKKAPPENDFTFPLQDEAEPAQTRDYYAQEQGVELAPMNEYKFPLPNQKTKPPPKKYYTVPLQYQEIKPVVTNEYGFLLQTQKAEPALSHNVVPPLQAQKAKPTQINSDVPPLQKQKPKPALKGDDILSLLYLSENERKLDDSSPEGLSIERKEFKDLTMNLVFDVIAEELRKTRE